MSKSSTETFPIKITWGHLVSDFVCLDCILSNDGDDKELLETKLEIVLIL